MSSNGYGAHATCMRLRFVFGERHSGGNRYAVSMANNEVTAVSCVRCKWRCMWGGVCMYGCVTTIIIRIAIKVHILSSCATRLWHFAYKTRYSTGENHYFYSFARALLKKHNTKITRKRTSLYFSRDKTREYRLTWVNVPMFALDIPHIF